MKRSKFSEAQVAFQHGSTLDFSRPGKPTDNAFAESSNAECLNTAWFLSLDDARRKCEVWRRDYNEERLHSPTELMNGAGSYGPPGTSASTRTIAKSR